MSTFITWFFGICGQIWVLITSYWFFSLAVICSLMSLVISLVLGAQRQD